LNHDHYTSKEGKDELLHILDMILERNYLQFNIKFFKQNEGLTMAAFIQHLEHTITYNILNKHQIMDYHLYVDDILIKYSERHTKIENTFDEFNRIHPKIKFTMEKETQNSKYYLDLTFIKRHSELTFGIYRKLIITDSIIHNDSCHPNEHKKPAINYLINQR
jgi:hypothetical protein